jgi:hypothetical protein
MRVTIRANGTLDYERRAKLGTVGVTGSRFAFGTDEIVVGVWPFTTAFRIDAAPHRDGQVLKLTLDGIELTRVDDLAQSVSTPGRAVFEQESRCRAGEGEACATLADRYGNGLGVPQDLARAAELLDKACHAHVPRACQNLIGMFNAGQVPRDPSRETNLLKTACADGHADSCTYIASWYTQGTHPGVSQDLPLAFDFYTKACAGNDPTGCHNLGIFYMRGIGVPKDIAKSASFYEKACGFDNLDSCNNLGLLLMQGEGIPRDLPRALGVYAGAATFYADEADKGYPLLAITPLGVFASIAWQSVSLWLRRPGALTIMQAMLAAQIPWINLHSADFHYDFSLLGAIIVRLGGADEPFEFAVGSRLDLSSQTGHDAAYFGINLVATYLFIYLTWRRMRDVR